MHLLGAEATEAFEGARATLANFVGAARSEEIVFTKNASEALNLCAHTLGAALRPGDEIVISVMEHHSNIVPWQLLAERTGATLRWFDVTDEGRLDLGAAAATGLINERTKIVSVAYVSNVLGTVNPIPEIADARSRGRRRAGRRRVPGRAADPGRRLHARRRPGGVHRAQDGRPDRHRGALGPLRPAGLAAALPRRRRDDRGRQDDRLDVRAAAASVRGRHPADRAGRRAGGRRPVPQRHRHADRRRPRARNHRLRAAGSGHRPGTADPGTRPSPWTAAAPSRSRCPISIRTT